MDLAWDQPFKPDQAPRASWTALHAQVHQTLRWAQRSQGESRLLLPPYSRLVVAVSGGQDSLCLLRLLVDLQAKWHWQLHVVHCDHRWQVNSGENAAFVLQVAAAWQVPAVCVVAEVPPGGEAAAREWRYHSLVQVAVERGCSHVVTGHTASDRAETVIYNLIRGSGADGLQALTWQRSLVAPSGTVQLVRPLLEVTRAMTGQFCQTQGIPVWEDATNQEVRLARNRIRLELLPYLKQHFNPQVELGLAQTAELLGDEVAYLEQQADQVWCACVEDDEGCQVNRRVLQGVDVALQRRVLRRVLQQILPRQPQFEHVEKLRALVAAANRSQTDPFPGGAIAVVHQDWICFQ